MTNNLMQQIHDVIDSSNLRKSVLLIDFTSSILANDSNYFFYSNNENISGYNLGIHRIGAYLQKFDVCVKIIRYEEFKDKIKRFIYID